MDYRAYEKDYKNLKIKLLASLILNVIIMTVVIITFATYPNETS